MIKFIIGFILGTWSGVILMCMLQINKKEVIKNDNS